MKRRAARPLDATGMLSILTTALLFFLRSGLSIPEERVRPLADLPAERMEIREWMRLHGWKSKRNSPRRFELGAGRLQLVSRDDSVLIGTREGFPIDSADWPRLRFRLRVDELPRGAELARKSGDDAAFRVYVAFDRGGGWFSPPNTIAYAWTEKLAPEEVVASPRFKRLRYLSLGKGLTTDASTADAEGWVTIERDLRADYRRVFGEGEVPDLVGVMLKCDSNDTGSSASAWVADLELVSGESEGSE